MCEFYAYKKLTKSTYKRSIMKEDNQQLIGQFKIAGITLLLALVVTNSAMAMKYRDNTIKIKSGDDLNFNLHSATYVITDFSVTSNQDPKNHVYKGLMNDFNLKNDVGEITYNIGRKKSYEVADWFRASIPYYKTTANNSPSELNFAFLGTLSMTISGGQYNNDATLVTFEDVAIAQGHNYNSNNWWFGGKNCEHDTSDETVTCQSTQTAWSAKFKKSGNTISLIEVIPTYGDYDYQHGAIRCADCPP